MYFPGFPNGADVGAAISLKGFKRGERCPVYFKLMASAPVA